MTINTSKMSCAFCGKSCDEVARLVAGPSSFICNECVSLCADIVRDANIETIARRIAKEEIESTLAVTIYKPKKPRRFRFWGRS